MRLWIDDLHRRLELDVLARIQPRTTDPGQLLAEHLELVARRRLWRFAAIA